MKAGSKRHIAPGHQYDALFPKSSGKDVVIVGKGNAKLEDTLQLIQAVVRQTSNDSQKLAKILNGDSVPDTCRRIWEFVYGHIQYKMDKMGIEQVRRPSRTWKDRKSGVDCDCYTVFIGSILLNLGIPFKMRVTKYGGKPHFQHIYPIVPVPGGHITIDCVTDRFNYEVPYSEKLDFGIEDTIKIDGIYGLSGVDEMDIELNALEQQSIPLRQPHGGSGVIMHCNPEFEVPKTKQKKGMVASPYRFKEGKTMKGKAGKDGFSLLELLMVTGISLAAGFGVLSLFEKKKRRKANSKKRTTGKKKTKQTPIK